MKNILVVLVIIVGVSFGVYAFSRTYLWQAIKPVNCEEMPTVEEANETIEENQELVDRIDATGKKVGIEVMETDRCEGKAWIVIRYGTIFERREIAKIIDDGMIGGYPVYWHNW